MDDTDSIVRLHRSWPGGAASRNGMVRLELQPENDDPTMDARKFWMTPGQALALIAELSLAAQQALKEQVS